MELHKGSAYSFHASGPYTTNISIFDNQGYLLYVQDMYDSYGFHPDRDGVFYISTGFTYVPGASGVITFRAEEDVGSDGKNNALAFQLGATVSNILRISPGDADARAGIYIEAHKYEPTLDTTAFRAAQVQAADSTTSVATLAYEFFTGKIPGAAGLDYLVSPTGGNANNLNSTYYQTFNLENRYINFAVNLGKLGEGKDPFLAKYGGLSP